MGEADPSRPPASVVDGEHAAAAERASSPEQVRRRSNWLGRAGRYRPGKGKGKSKGKRKGRSRSLRDRGSREDRRESHGRGSLPERSPSAARSASREMDARDLASPLQPPGELGRSPLPSLSRSPGRRVSFVDAAREGAEAEPLRPAPRAATPHPAADRRRQSGGGSPRASLMPRRR